MLVIQVKESTVNTSDIKLMQRALRETVTPDLTADGVWGNQSKTALAKYAQVFGVNAVEAEALVLKYANLRFVGDSAFTSAAALLKVPESYVRAVAAVESNGESFLKDGRVKILFERHKFYKYLKEALVASESIRSDVARLLGLPSNSSAISLSDTVEKRYANLYNSVAGGYIGGAAEWDRLGTAMTFNIEAACKSASFGGYQLMGFNYSECGYNSAREMLLDMAVSESAQFLGMIRFIKANPKMLLALQNGDWAEFAMRYNGANYAIKRYDQKLKLAEAEWSKLTKK